MSESRGARAIAFGVVVGAVLAAANVYVGLEIGFVDSGTSTIILLTFAVFGAGLRRFSGSEAAIAAAAGSSAAIMAITAGTVGPVAALALSGHAVSLALVMLWAIGLGLLGTLVAIPFRESLLEIKKLAFPSAHAAGVAIHALFVDGGRARESLRLLVGGTILAALLTVLRDQFQVEMTWMVPIAIAGVSAAQLGIGVSASPLLVGVGFLVGLRVALSMLLGAVIAWVAIGPAIVSAGIAKPSYPSIVSWTLWPGAALMVASSVTSCLLDGRELVRSVARELRGTGASRRLQLASATLALGLVALGWLGFGVNPAFCVLAIVLATVFSVAAMYATGETDNTPSGPLGGLAQIVVGPIGPGGVVTPLHAGGVVNGVATQASTMLSAWKTGEAVGAKPSRVFVAQVIGVFAGALASVAAYWLIREAYGLGTDKMPMPGVMSWKATADAVSHGTASMPQGAPLAALVGVIVGVLLTLASRRVRHIPSAVAMGVGFILPATLSIMMVVGAVIAALFSHRRSDWQEQRGAPLASGFIAGEALTGVVLAAVVVASQ